MSEMLQALLGAENSVEEEVYIKRFNGHFRIKAIDGVTLNKLREQATHYVGKGANRKKHFDEEEFNGLLIATACLDPDFNNDELKKKYEVATASDCVQKALLAGEIMKLQEAILKLSGFDEDEEAVEEVKN
jgi:Phage XkdN-like tail assembly chaperone protein, TAC